MRMRMQVFLSALAFSWFVVFLGACGGSRNASIFVRDLLTRPSSESSLIQRNRRLRSTSNYNALDVLFCHDDDSMKYFYWRKDWKWPHCPYYLPDGKPSNLGRKVVPGTQMTLVFVIFNDKITAMKEFLRSIHENVQTSFQLVVIETASMIPEALNFVDWMREHGMPVIFTSPMFYAEYMDYLGYTIYEYVHMHPEYSYYVVTDPDLSFKGIKGDIFPVFAQLLSIYPDIPAVGSALRIDDIDNSSYNMQIPAWEGKNVLEWESSFWPHTINGTQLLYSPLKVYHYTALIDTTFMMCRRDLYWHRLNLGLRVIAPYELRHVDWYYSPSTGMPLDMVIYTCRKWASHITHARLEGCPELFAEHNITEEALFVPSYESMRPNYFVKERVKRIVGDPIVNIFVGTLSPEARASRRGFWVDFNRQAPYTVTESRITYSDLPIPHDNGGNLTELSYFFPIEVEGCPSYMYPSTKGILKEDFMLGFDENCKKVVAREGSDDIHFKGSKSSPADSVERGFSTTWNCVAGNSVESETVSVIALSTVVRHLTMFHINEVDFQGIQGYDMAFLRSIEEFLPVIHRVKLSCQYSYHLFQLDDIEDNNDCEKVLALLQKYGFGVDSKRVKNCGIDEYEIKASKRTDVAKFVKHAKREQSVSVAIAVRMSTLSEAVYREVLKPSIDSFLSRRLYQLVYILGDTEEDRVLGKHLQEDKFVTVHFLPWDETSGGSLWMYALDSIINADVIGVLSPSDSLHTFLTHADIIDNSKKLFVAATGESNPDDMAALGLTAQWSVDKIDLAPRFFFRSTLTQCKAFLQKQFQAADFTAEVIAKLSGLHPLNVLFNFAAQHEQKHYHFVGPTDSLGMVMVGSQSKALATKYIRAGCCRSFPTAECDDKAKRDTEHLLHFYTTEAEQMGISFGSNAALVKDHYAAVKYHLKRMNRVQQKKMSGSCRRLIS